MLEKYIKLTNLNKIMLQKLIQNKWTVIAIVVAIIVAYYFYQKNYGEN